MVRHVTNTYVYAGSACFWLQSSNAQEIDTRVVFFCVAHHASCQSPHHIDAATFGATARIDAHTAMPVASRVCTLPFCKHSTTDGNNLAITSS